LCSEYFRFFDIRQAEGITMAGQLSIQWIERKLNEYLNKLLKTDNKDFVIAKLMPFNPDLIVLAGFLWKFPEPIIAKYPNQIINIHPALLPKYGGKGMYGKHVHQAVLNNQETETGITIHFVNEHYDEGGIIFQKSVSISDCTSADEIANKVHELEHRYFPEVISQLITRNPQL
jgi:phosphoribosylglycinamide formyltransferase-1